MTTINEMSRQTDNSSPYGSGGEASGPSNRTVLRILLIILVVLGVLWVISKITGLILLLVLSIFFAYLVSPLVEFLRRPEVFGHRIIAIT